MSAEEYIQELSVFIDLVRAHRPKRILGNMVDFRFPITPVDSGLGGRKPLQCLS